MRSDSGCGAEATFEAHGEIWRICDTKADGHGARLYMAIDGQDPKITGDWSGSADEVCTILTDEILEGTPIEYRLCLTEKGKDIGVCDVEVDTA